MIGQAQAADIAPKQQISQQLLYRQDVINERAEEIVIRIEILVSKLVTLADRTIGAEPPEPEKGNSPGEKAARPDYGSTDVDGALGALFEKQNVTHERFDTVHNRINLCFDNLERLDCL